MNNEQAKQVIDELHRRGAATPCSRCGAEEIIVSEDLAFICVKYDPSIYMNSNSIPAALVICQNCGNTTFHALYVLGLEGLADGEAGLDDPAA